MPESDQRRRLIDLFRETGPAHHHAYRATDGADPDWPLWYAEYTQARLNALLGTALTRSELTYLLVSVEMERAAQAPGAAWPDYYADFFLHRYGAMAGRMPPAPRM
jgi:NAD(P)H-hydrate epimerase